MISTSSKPRYSDSQLRSIRIGRDIHAAIIEEARQETSARQDGSKVFGYLDHDLIGSGKLPFLKYDQRSGKYSRTFSKRIAKEVKDHVEDLKVYFEYVLQCDRDEQQASSSVVVRSRREIAAERIARVVDGGAPV